MMRKKLPPWMIFDKLGEKPIDILTNIAEKSGWDQPLRGVRFYKAHLMIRALIYYYITQLSSLDTLEADLAHDPAVRVACGFTSHTPSKSTFARFLQHLGSDLLEELFYQLVELMFDKGLVTGRHLAIDSTHVNAWSDRKSKENTDPDFKLGKNCDFARLGKTPKGFDVCYRVHVATVTKSEIPIAIEIFPGNMNDKRAFSEILERAQEHVPDPLVISADKGYSSGKTRQLVADTGAMCIIRPTKTEIKSRTMEFFQPEELVEPKYWLLYLKRLAVERTFGRTKGYFRFHLPSADGTSFSQHGAETGQI